MAASSWYAITYNDARLVSPDNLSDYTFRIQDLPMLLSLTLFILYFLYLFLLLIQSIIANKRREASGQVTRKLDPKLGCLGFFYEGKMSGAFHRP